MKFCLNLLTYITKYTTYNNPWAPAGGTMVHVSNFFPSKWVNRRPSTESHEITCIDF